MTKIWSEPYDHLRHHNHMGGDAPGQERYWKAPTLEPYHVAFVRVCGFTFEFHTVDQLRACRDFYAKKLHPSRRSHAAAEAVRKDEVAWRHEVERWFERLPLYLREESKRPEVAAALDDALRQAESGSLQLSTG